MLKKVRNLFRRVKPMAFIFMTMVSGYLAMSKSVMEKSIE